MSEKDVKQGVVKTEKEQPEKTGHFLYKLQKPKTIYGKEYTEFAFDFTKITGNDILSVQRSMMAENIPMGDDGLAGSLEFVTRLAGHCSGVSGDIIASLDYADFIKITSRVQSFLIFGV